jgi:hypothetical protein
LTQGDAPIKAVVRAFRMAHGLMAALFACSALMLITIAAHMGWLAFIRGLDSGSAQTIIEAVGPKIESSSGRSVPMPTRCSSLPGSVIAVLCDQLNDQLEGA